MNVDRVRMMLTQQWPDWEINTIEVLSTKGWDFLTFKADGQWVVRVARNAWQRRKQCFEAKLLDKIHQSLNFPIEIPVYQRVGGAVGVYTFIPGKSLDQVKGRNDRILGQKIGQFLYLWHSQGTSSIVHGDAVGHAQERWQRLWKRTYGRAQDNVWPILGVKEARQFDRWMEDLLYISGQCTPVLLHGDLALSNILYDEGKITGIIDFTDMTVGDAAYDFVGLQSLAEGVRDCYPNAPDRERVALYRWGGILRGTLSALTRGDVESVERGINLLRRGVVE